MQEKKIYQTPEITKVEFDASDRITASNCWDVVAYQIEIFAPECYFSPIE